MTIDTDQYNHNNYYTQRIPTFFRRPLPPDLVCFRSIEIFVANLCEQIRRNTLSENVRICGPLLSLYEQVVDTPANTTYSETHTTKTKFNLDC